MPASGHTHNVPDLNTATHLLATAKEAADMARKLVRSGAPRTLTWKGDRDITSDTDVAVERVIRDFLRTHTPSVGFLGEEEGGSKLGDGYQWILDPIDGTINFLHGVPLCAISLSLIHDGTTLTSVIDLPFLDARYSAVKGCGSYVNDQRIHVSNTATLRNALVSIDQYTFDENSTQRNKVRHHLAGKLATQVQRLRMIGASGVDLAWTAHGRFDACVLLGNKPWDTSAGVLIAQEAGARVLDLDGSDHSLDSLATIAVTPALEHELMSVIHEAIDPVATSS
ncbi:MAG: inositol monophosphatase family protein [Pseudonocardiaceae bacterium]